MTARSLSFDTMPGMANSVEASHLEEWSGDGQTLTIRTPTPQGVVATTVRWNHKPTPAQIATAIEKALAGDVEEGQATRRRKWGPLLFIVNTGPPTWWWPRVHITRRPCYPGVMVGWLRLSLDVSHAPWSTK